MAAVNSRGDDMLGQCRAEWKHLVKDKNCNHHSVKWSVSEVRGEKK